VSSERVSGGAAKPPRAPWACVWRAGDGRSERTKLLAEHLVEELGERPGEDRKQQDDNLDQLRRVITHREAVPRAVRLRDDLAKDEDKSGGGDDADGAREPRHAVDQDGEDRVDQRVSQEQRAQQQVAALADRQNPLGVHALARIVARDDDLQLRLVEGHQAERQAREERRATDQQ